MMNRIIVSLNRCHLIARVGSVMANKHQSDRLRFIFLLTLCTHFLTADQDCECKDNNIYVIRSTGPNGLVLDATLPDHIKVQHFTGSDVQLWQFQPVGRPGYYYIMNEYHGKALDVILGDDGFFHLAVNNLHKGLTQQWNFDLKGRFVNAGVNKNIDIHRASYNPGTQLIAWENNGCGCQRFTLQQKLIA